MSRKNVLFILVDQERMSMHMPKSATIDALEGHTWLKEHGLSFRNYHVATAPCTPSRSVIFTGWHTPRNLMTDNLDFPDWIRDMSTGITTLGDMAEAAGYYPVYKGKWHLSHIAPESDPNEPPPQEKMADFGFRDYQHFGDLHSSGREGYTHDDYITSEAIYWLNDWINYRTSESKEKPFFLVVGLVNPHDVMTVDVHQTAPTDPFMELMTPPNHALYNVSHNPGMPASFYDDYTQSTQQPNKPSAHKTADEINSALLGRVEQSQTKEWTDLVNYYINCHFDVDRSIKRLIDYLEETGLAKDTIIVFTADHGELAGAHGMRNKGPFIYEENNHVPLIICHPSYPSSHNTKTDVLATSLDIATTLMSLFENPNPYPAYEHLYGADLSLALRTPGWAGPQRAGILYTYTSLSSVDMSFVAGTEPDFTKRGFLFGVQTAEWKFARYFSPESYSTLPVEGEVLWDRSRYELELYSTPNLDDANYPVPQESRNRAYDRDTITVETVVRLNDLLNRLVETQLAETSWNPMAWYTPPAGASTAAARTVKRPRTLW